MEHFDWGHIVNYIIRIFIELSRLTSILIKDLIMYFFIFYFRVFSFTFYAEDAAKPLKQY